MGVAAIMIIICHAPGSRVLMPHWLGKIFLMGNYGVDVFLFLSGLGCYYSLDNNHKIISFYKRRFYRLFLPYVLIFLPYCIILFYLGVYSLSDCLLSVTALEYWFFHRGAWFVSLVVVLYFLSPFLYRVFIGKKKWVIVTVLVLVITFLSNLQVGEKTGVNVIDNIQFALSRTSSFIIGMALGQDCKSKQKVSIQWLFITAIIGVILLYVLHVCGTEWMITPLLLYLIILVLKALAKFSFFSKVLDFMGRVSLESYLTNITLNSLLVILIPTYFSSPVFYGRYLEYLFVIVMGLTIAYFINRISNRVMKLFVGKQ